MEIFGENSPVRLLEFFERKVFDYSDLREYFPLTEDDIRLLETVRDWNGKTEVSDRLEYLNDYLHLPRVKYMGMEWNEWLTAKIAEQGDLKVLKYVRSKNCPWDYRAIHFAAVNGNLSCLKYLFENDCPLEEPILRWGWNHDSNGKFRFEIDSHTDMTMNCTVMNGHLKCVDFLHSNGFVWNQHTAGAAVEGGNLEMLKYLRSRECPWNHWVYKNAVRKGLVKILKYAIEGKCPYDKYRRMYVCKSAIQDDHLDCLELLSENGWKIPDDGFRLAAAYGSLNCLKFLLSKGYEWNEEEVCDLVLRNGYLECLKYVTERNFPWNEDAYQAAIYGKKNCRTYEKSLEYERCLRYIDENPNLWKVQRKKKRVY